MSALITTIIHTNKDILWFIIWIVTIVSIGLWNLFFLNKPAQLSIITGFCNTGFITMFVIVLTLAIGWIITQMRYFLYKYFLVSYYLLIFFLNIIRSVPQVVGILFGAFLITTLKQQQIITTNHPVFFLTALIMSLFLSIEVSDLFMERIIFFKRSDFFDAMRVCGVSEFRIINIEILWKNSRIHLYNKLIAIAGMSVFLQCSVDFILSVGLFTDVSSVNLPTTLGSLLAHIDSKQDILAIGYALTHPLYAPQLLFKNLQGITVAFVIVFTLVCIHRIAQEYAERHKL